MKNPETTRGLNPERQDYSPYNLKQGVVYSTEFLETVCDKRGEELTQFLNKFNCQKKEAGYLLNKALIDKLIFTKERNLKKNRKTTG